MPNRWLFKEEPGNYPFDRLLEDGQAVWDGVRNNWAQKNLRSAEEGDEVLYYHTGRERSVVGIARITTAPYPDPDDDGLVVVDIEPVERLAHPVTLAQIKAESCFAESPLVKMGRLSVVPLTAEQFRKVRTLAKG